MTPGLWLALAGLFISVGLLTGLGASAVLTRNSPERRRLRLAVAGSSGGTGLVAEQRALTEDLDPGLRAVAARLPKSPKEMGRLRRRLATAGIYSFRAAIILSVLEIALPLTFAGAVLWRMHDFVGFVIAAVMGIAGHLVPSLILGRLITRRKLRIENGLADALDLIIVCVQAGCGLDQAIVKTTDELELSHPDLARELKSVITEIRAGKPRIEAFKNFSDRTRVEDVRSLVAMLIQTDRFGTSISQALRTHAATSRLKRKQRAEERAAKVGVKLVFPLVLCLFPAFYVVVLGPAVVMFARSSLFTN
jgi:tight adherence protein C